MKIYPEKTGCLCANSHPGSYSGQDAYNDMLIVIRRDKCSTGRGRATPNLYQGGVASALKNRDYKDFTDIIQEDEMDQADRKYVLRRLTPTECARLQGFPDWWCDGADGSDSAQFKLWGNGIALPCACDVLGRIVEEIRNNG